MSEERLALVFGAAAVILQAVSVWQNRKPRKPKGRHRRE